MSPRRSFPLGMTAPLVCACSIGTAGLEIHDASPLAPADTAPLCASNDNCGDTGDRGAAAFDFLTERPRAAQSQLEGQRSGVDSSCERNYQRT
jgi:hypothetical protein